MCQINPAVQSMVNVDGQNQVCKTLSPHTKDSSSNALRLEHRAIN